MAETTGHVVSIKVNATANSNFAIFVLAVPVRVGAAGSATLLELFFVWSKDESDQYVPTGPQWMHRALQVSLLRDALLANKTVTVFHDDTSSFVNSLQVNA